MSDSERPQARTPSEEGAYGVDSELLPSLESLHGLLELSPDAMVIVSRSGEIVLVNSQTDRLFGYGRNDLRGRSVEVLVPERFRGSHAGHREGFFQDPRIRPMGAGMELYGRRRDGTEFPVEISLSPLKTLQGRFVCSAIRDITERKQAEKRFRELLESAPDAMVIADQQGRIVLVNAQTERMFGWRREELLGSAVEVLVPARFRGRHPAHRGAYFSMPQVRPMGAGLELFGQRKDGSEFPVEISLSPLETEGGTLVSSAIRDISDRRDAEDARARLASIVESPEDAVIAKDLAGTILSWNTGAERIFGYSGEEIIGRSVNELIPAERQEEEAALLIRVRIGSRVEPYETVRCRKDGSRFDAVVTISPIKNAKGEIIAAWKILRDISARKKQEAFLLESLQEKETMLREIHHRVKNNLAVISSLFYLESTYARDDQTVRLLQEAQDRVRSMALVHESLYRSANLAAVDFGEYARALLDYLFRTYGLNSGQVHLRTEIDQISLSVEKAIPCGLILNELLTNSLKHAFPNGRAGEIRIGLNQASEGRCHMTVTDDGIGIDSALDVQQVRSLGLRLVRSLTGQLHGEFEIRRTDPGTEARLSFPQGPF